MKQGLHPNWHHDCKVTCSCGNTFVTGATATELKVDICSACHPFFTGEMKFVDRQGRVDKFMKQRAAAATVAAQAAQAKKKAQKSNKPAKSYKQILQEQQDAIKALKSQKTTETAPAAAKTAASETVTAKTEASTANQ